MLSPDRFNQNLTNNLQNGLSTSKELILEEEEIEEEINGVEVEPDNKKYKLDDDDETITTISSKFELKLDGYELLHTLPISENDVNIVYKKLFNVCLDDMVSVINVTDPYIQTSNQVKNFVMFCSAVINKARNLKTIILSTKKDKQNEKYLKEVEENLKRKNIILSVHFDDTLHDRDIQFDNGWKVVMGRGLDIYKYVSPFSLDYLRPHLYPCKACNIFYMKRKEKDDINQDNEKSKFTA
uniref:MITD1 C-terminal phospholipase D-like domain-containing protein n=1 Tax=Acrobeloides nanus TaxID=290746 RepID=A0A914CD53_9BILA